jgi:hypothetical protein
MIAERLAVEHLRRADQQRVWVIQTREGADLSHFYASILSGLHAPQAAGWRSLSRASEQVDNLLDSVKPRLLIFGEFHGALRGRRQDVKAIFSFLRRIARVHDISPVLVGEMICRKSLSERWSISSHGRQFQLLRAVRNGSRPAPSWASAMYRCHGGGTLPSGELRSSWLLRLAHANGVLPRDFGAVLGAAGEEWSAQLDRHLPEAVRRLMLDHTSICPKELAGLCLGPSQLSVLRLGLRTRPQDAGTSTEVHVASCLV